MTTPKAQGARIGWSFVIALLAFLLGWKWWVNATPIWALLIVSASTPLFDRLWKGEAFRWVKHDADRPASIESETQALSLLRPTSTASARKQVSQ